MTDLDTLVRSGLRDAAATVGAPDTAALAEALRAAPPVRRHRARTLLVAAAVLVVGAVVAVAAWPDDDGQDLRVSAPSTTTPLEGFEALGAGWHDLDTGPVEPDASHQVVWTGTELVVLSGSGRTWRYEPGLRRWSTASRVPLPAPSTGWSAVGTAWTGEQLVAVFSRLGGRRWSAAWDPSDDEWRPLGDVPVAPELAAALDVSIGPTLGAGTLIWTGERVFDMAHLASIDPAGPRGWESLPLPADLVSFASLLSTEPVFDGREVVYVNLVGRGLRWVRDASSYHELDPAPSSVTGPPQVVPSTSALAHDGEVFLVANPGDAGATGPVRAAAVDAGSGAWRPLPAPPDLAEARGCPYDAAAIAGVVAIDRCDLPGVLALVDGAWTERGPFGGAEVCCNLVQAGAALVRWDNNTDTANDPDAPHVRAKVWVPPT